MPVRLKGSPNAGEPHGVTECMDEDSREQRSGPHKHKSSIYAEQVCVGKLQDRVGNGHHEWVSGTCDSGLVEMMQMRQTKYKRRLQYHLLESRVGHEEQRYCS